MKHLVAAFVKCLKFVYPGLINYETTFALL